MNKTMLRILTLVCAMLMLFGTVGLVACVAPTPDDPAETTPGGETPPEDPPVDTSWLKSLDEKIAALNNYYGRVMSVAWAGDTANHAPGSLEAINAAVELGADAIGVVVQLTSDGVAVALPGDSIFDTTDYQSKKGTNGLPSNYETDKWTYAQLQELYLLNADESVSDKKIAKLEDVVKACDGKCFLYIRNAKEFDKTTALYDVAKATGAYSVFMVSPGVNAITDWALADKANTALASFVSGTCKKFYHQEDYFDVRFPTDPTVSDKNAGWTRVSDDAEGWEKAYKAKRTFMITGKIADQVQWIAKNFVSALEYTPDQFDNISYTYDKEDLTARYMFISDLHYTPVEQPGFVNRVTYRGYSTEERMEHMCENIRNEYKERGLDAIFVLGDLTTDDPPHRGNHYYLEEVYKKYLTPLSKELNVPILSTGGNHDGYNNTMFWKKWVGMDRQFAWENTKTGDVVLMVDTFNPNTTPANKAGSGVSWSGNDEAWIATQLEKYKDRKNVFIASHYFSRGANLNGLAELVLKYDNVRALFDAHSHTYIHDTVELSTYNEGGVALKDTGRMIINTGSYSYGDWGMGTYINGSSTNDFNYHDFDDIWGYQIVEITEDKALSYRIDVDAYYCANNYSTLGKPGGVFIEVRDYRPYTKYADIVFY